MYVKDVCGAYLYLLKVPPFLSFIMLDAVTVAVTIRNKTIKATVRSATLISFPITS